MHTIAVILVAFARVRPIEHKDAAIRAVSQIDSTKPGVTKLNEIGFMPANIAGALTLEMVLVDAASVIIDREHLMPMRSRPVIALVNHEPAVGVPAAEGVGA